MKVNGKIDDKMVLEDTNETTEQPMIDLLNLLLADLQVFGFAMRNFHWNVQGTHFFDMHAQYERLYKEIDQLGDTVAERVKILGYYPLARLDHVLKHATIEEPANFMSAKDMVQYTVRGLTALVKRCAELTKVSARKWEVGTTELLSSSTRKLEKECWKWRNLLK